jgi:4,5-DOPA dioxygenase extradiol
MYPEADVPVVQVSVQTDLGTRHHLAIGKALRSLADENILVIGSGHLTHNLRDWARGQGKAEPYAKEFQQWVFKNIETHGLESLADYRSASPHGVRSHPTEEHFLPLFVALGAAPENYQSERIFDDIEAGVLAMDAYLFQ